MVKNYEYQAEHVVLDIGQDIGALIIYTTEDLYGKQIDVSLKENATAKRVHTDVLNGKQIDVSLKENATAKRVHTDVLKRKIGGRSVFAAVFASLPAGEYITWSDPAETFTIVGGGIVELNWRDADIYVPPVSSTTIEARGTGQGISSLSGILPPRYQGGRRVSSAPMGTAPMQYTENGQVAWNEMWTNFCDLALAGGPPHRDILLEPVAPEEVRANIAGYERVLAEIERGLRLVTGMPILRSERLGWIGLKCEDEEMALWLLRAIIVENICVRREASVLFLPVGPDFHIEKEIKNVITVVAKTHHYWMEHRGV